MVQPLYITAVPGALTHWGRLFAFGGNQPLIVALLATRGAYSDRQIDTRRFAMKRTIPFIVAAIALAFGIWAMLVGKSMAQQHFTGPYTKMIRK